MYRKFPQEAQEIMNERFGHDNLIALATVEDGEPWVRAVNAYYEDGAFYIVTNARSNKMRQIQKGSGIAICGDWFTAHGTGENLGHVLEEKNAVLMEKLRTVFAQWYSNGHINEQDPGTCILCVHLRDGVLFSHGKRYAIDFTKTEE